MKFFDQLYKFVDVGMSQESVNVTEFMLNGGDISVPNFENIQKCADRWQHKKYIVLDIETLGTKLGAKYGLDPKDPKIEAIQSDIRLTYYTLVKKYAPKSLVAQYNTTRFLPSDFVWLSNYRWPNESVDTFMKRVEARLTGLPDGKFHFLNTSPVVFSKDGDTLMPVLEFAEIIKRHASLMIHGLSFWYRVPEKTRLEIPDEYFEVIRQAVIDYGT